MIHDLRPTELWRLVIVTVRIEEKWNHLRSQHFKAGAGACSTHNPKYCHLRVSSAVSEDHPFSCL